MNATLWIAIFASVLGSLLASLQLALRDFSLRKLQTIAEGNGGLVKVAPIIEDPEGHALSLGALRVLVNVVLVVSIIRLFESEAGGVLDITTPRLLAAGAVAAAALYLFNTLIPTSVADHAGERLIHAAATPIRVFHALALPLRPLRVVDEAIRRLSGVRPTTEKEELEEELLDVVTEGELEGSLEATERNMIERVVKMHDITTDEIMTPRTEMEGIELSDDLLSIRAFIAKAGHSRIPVWEGNPDHIVGVLYAKDLLRFLGEDPASFQLGPALREALFVPESKPVSELLIELQAKKVHLAIVLDEYGGTAGLVTLEDVVEEIVGEIEDEYEPEDEAPPEIRVLAEERAAELDARAYIKDANAALASIGVSLPEHDDYDTVGGYVLHVLGHIPAAGERFRENGHAVEVLEAEPTRVTRLRIEGREEGAEARRHEDAEVGEEGAKARKHEGTEGETEQADVSG